MPLLCLVAALSLSATATRGANILFVSSMSEEHMIGDDALKAFMEGLGHTVTYLDDDEDEATTEAAAAAADMVFISESCGSGNIRNEITELEVPMIVGEPWAWDEMGLTEGEGGDDPAVTTDVEIVDSGHYLAAGLSGTVAVLTDITSALGGCNLGKGITGPEATVIATATLSDGVTYDVIFIYEKGAALPVAPADGSAQVAADIRIGFGFHLFCDPVLNENAYAMLGAAVDYALGLVGDVSAQIDPATVETGHVYLLEDVVDINVPDDSANDNTGTIVGDPQVVDGLKGKALQFDGVDDGIDIPDSNFINVNAGPWLNRTVIAVFKCDDVTKQEKQTVFEEGGLTRGLTIYVFDGEVYVGGWNKSDYEPQWNPGSWISAPINSNQWYAVALVIRDGTPGQEDDKFEMWMDGVLIGKAPGAEIWNHGNDNAIGYTNQNVVFHDGDGSGDGWFFEGAIDELWILNDALTETELGAWVGKVLPFDVTASGDTIQGVPNDGDWPGAETPDLAIDDNIETKYLHFKGDFDPDPGTGGAGFQVTPSAGPTIVTGLTLTTANDVPGRDPIAFELSGSNESIDGPYELIASGDVVDFAGETEWPRFTMNETKISFDNDVAYTNYQLIFTAIRGPVGGSVNSMQIAEVELLGVRPPPPAPPIVHYKLDDGEGAIAVDSANGLDGILMGDPQWTAGVLDGALDFDGDGDYVDCGNNATINGLSDAITVSAWVSIRSVSTTWMSIVMKGETAWRLGVNGDTTGVHWAFTGGDRGWQAANSVTELPLDEWHHIAGTYDRSVGATNYVDGVAEAVNPDPDGVATNEMPLLLGENPEALGRFYDGLLDDVRIYDRALSAAEISELASLPPYVYDGDALDDTWNHDNGSDQWDGTGPGEGNPGGAAALIEDGVTFLRIQDIGDPRDLGISEPSNRKVYLQRPMDISLDGARLEFRIRIATSAPLDNQVTGEPWPAEGIGYHIRDNGKGMIGIGEAGEAGVGIISFSLAHPGEAGFEDVATDVLVMNNLVGTEASGDVDTGDAAAAVAMNMIAVDDATQWNTFTIDISAGGAGTHIVTVSVNGGPAESFEVTIGTDLENDTSSLLIGSSGTGGVTAFDVDYVSVQ